MMTEAKLFILTKLLFAMYDTEARVLYKLKEMMKPLAYFDYWMERYYQIDNSKELQVVMLKNLGLTYREIQKLAKVSPNKIKAILNEYELEYTPLEHFKDVAREMDLLEKRMEREGIRLW